MPAQYIAKHRITYFDLNALTSVHSFRILPTWPLGPQL